MDDLAGLGSRRPLVAAVMAVVMFSLAGIPPTAGFMAKFYLFSALVYGGYVEMAVIGLLFSGVSLYYYLRVVVCMYMRPAAEVPAEAAGRLSYSGMTALCLSALAILAVGVFPLRIASTGRAGGHDAAVSLAVPPLPPMGRHRRIGLTSGRFHAIYSGISAGATASQPEGIHRLPNNQRTGPGPSRPV